MRSQYNFSSRPTGRSGFGPGALSPFIKWMLIANGGIFLLQNVYPQLTMTLGLVPAQFFSEFPNKLFQPFTYMFLHGGFGHLFFNLFALWMFGTEIEYTWGSRSFGRFYLLAGFFGAMLTLIFHPGQMGPTIGASAAIYGVMIAYWIMFPNRMLYIYFVFPVKVKWAVPGFMLLGFFFSGGNIAHMAHLGGALFALFYLKADWRWLSLGAKIKNLRRGRQEAKLEQNRQRAEDVMKRVDSILDKINEVGLENLSKEEKKFLEKASSNMSSDNMKNMD